MSQPLIPGFSPYNVPIKQAKRAGVEARPVQEQPRGTQQTKPQGRWNEPAVQVRLSREALALLNGEGNAMPEQAKATSGTASVKGAFDALLDGQGTSAEGASQPVRAEPYARSALPGSKINILV